MFSSTNEFVVKIKLCSEMCNCIKLMYEDVTDANDIPSGIRNSLKTSDNRGHYITVNDLKWLYSKMPLEKKRDLYKYLQTSHIILPKPEVSPRNPELEARIEKLKIIAAEKEYQTMTKNVDSSRVKHPEDTISSQLREMNRQMIAVLQVIVSVSAAFVFGFSGIEYVSGQLATDTRLFLGLFCAGIVMTAELYFLIKKIHTDEITQSDTNHCNRDHPHRE